MREAIRSGSDSLLEGHRSVDRVLTNHGVNDEEGLVRVGSSLDVSRLSHHLGVDTQTTSGVDDDDVVQLVLGLCDGITGYLDGIPNSVARFRSEDVHPGTFSDHLQLSDGIGPLEVAGGQQRGVALFLEPLSQLPSQGRLASTLQAGKHDDRRGSLRKTNRTGLPSEDLDEFLVDNLDDLLGRIERFRKLLAVATLFNGRHEFLDDRQVDVSLK